jgi:hypothetical protein
MHGTGAGSMRVYALEGDVQDSTVPGVVQDSTVQSPAAAVASDGTNKGIRRELHSTGQLASAMHKPQLLVLLHVNMTCTSCTPLARL